MAHGSEGSARTTTGSARVVKTDQLFLQRQDGAGKKLHSYYYLHFSNGLSLNVCTILPPPRQNKVQNVGGVGSLGTPRLWKTLTKENALLERGLKLCFMINSNHLQTKTLRKVQKELPKSSSFDFKLYIFQYLRLNSFLERSKSDAFKSA